ncbi:hypothetical protein [Formosa sp. PL04]|uniref:hypothetical protein n=1 Tax=Formosa sp. PL04 TaxID=3081755 RepID=UPI002981950F|nr:hypothetical protein [Formosa sp. PL04]MDW5289486.1 hypothetical protein [Formosa sp. PL04]
MKKIITLSICMLVMTSSFASTFSGIAFSKKGDGSKMEITLTLNDVKAGQKLSIKDNKGTLLFNKTIEKSGAFNNRFDLSQLPDGTYHFEHEKNHYVKHIPFTVYLGEVTFDKENESIVYKPVVRVKNNLIYLSKLDLEKENIEVRIYYTGNDENEYQLLHSENITDTIKVERVYRLSEQYKGEYKIVINTNDESYVEHFKI